MEANRSIPSLPSYAVAIVTALFAVALFPPLAHADLNIILKNSFIEKYKNRASITARFEVDQATKPHPAADDADIHISGHRFAFDSFSMEMSLPAEARQ